MGWDRLQKAKYIMQTEPRTPGVNVLAKPPTHPLEHYSEQITVEKGI